MRRPWSAAIQLRWKSIYRAEDFDGFVDIFTDFDDWSRDYVEYNKPSMPMIAEGHLAGMTYCAIYKGNDHYNQMASLTGAGDPSGDSSVSYLVGAFSPTLLNRSSKSEKSDSYPL